MMSLTCTYGAVAETGKPLRGPVRPAQLARRPRPRETCGHAASARQHYNKRIRLAGQPHQWIKSRCSVRLPDTASCDFMVGPAEMHRLPGEPLSGGTCPYPGRTVTYEQTWLTSAQAEPDTVRNCRCWPGRTTECRWCRRDGATTHVDREMPLRAGVAGRRRYWLCGLAAGRVSRRFAARSAAAVMYLACTSSAPFMYLRWNCRPTLIQQPRPPRFATNSSAQIAPAPGADGSASHARDAAGLAPAVGPLAMDRSLKGRLSGAG